MNRLIDQYYTRDAATQELKKAVELDPELKENAQWILGHLQKK